MQQKMKLRMMQAMISEGQSMGHGLIDEELILCQLKKYWKQRQNAQLEVYENFLFHSLL